MKRYSTVFIDWHKTLSQSKFWGDWQKETHTNSRLYRYIQNMLFSEPYELANNWMRGKYTSEEVIQEIAQKSQESPSVILNELIKSCQAMKMFSDRLPELIVKLKKEGVKTVLVTDNMDCFSRWAVPSLSLQEIFNDILNSYYTKLLKSDLDDKGKSILLEKYITNNELNREHCVLIDDSQNLKPIAQKSGITFFHATNKKSTEMYLLKILKAL